jgi:LysM repeat protein
VTKPAAPLLLLIFAALLVGCVRPWPGSDTYLPARGGGGDAVQALLAPTLAALPTTSRVPSSAAGTPAATRAPALPGAPSAGPTPDPPHALPTLRSQPETYAVQAGDTLAAIAQRYQVSLQTLLAVNPSADPNLVYVGTRLTIPAPSPDDTGSDFKIIPDSELVYGPRAADFDTVGFIKQRGGKLVAYHETVDDVDTYGPQIVDRIAHEYSVNPRLLLAVLEYTGHWVTESNPTATPLAYPMGYPDPGHTGLFRQLSWAADNLNRGFYLWQANGLAMLGMPSGDVVPVAPTINAGTVGVQYLFSLLGDKAAWRKAVAADGVYQTFTALFGDPFSYAIEPLIPAGLTQPPMQLPFEPNTPWSFTGGPHGGWASGSAWAAIDFAPPGDAYGCFISDAWDAAVANGLIVRAGGGAVIEDLDGDGLEQTGWTILYMHVATSDRVAVGTHVHAGDRIGHPSCEGGVADGTHLHLARRYNGAWIAADGSMPFNLDGWVTSGDGTEYDGVLTRNGQSIEAWDGRTPANQIQR